MRILKRGAREAPLVSFVLLDWSVRESFHFLHYLAHQTVDRRQFEVIVVEYYSRQSDALKPFLDQVDTWALLEMPEDCYYHKHAMYNAGIVLSRGRILTFCDSDAMVKPSFVEAIVRAFDAQPELVLHLDQFRNVRRSFYPFNYPTFDDVLGPGCINNVDGRTKGVAAPTDPLHDRNYGACMCARREDLLAVGGADEHLDYLGHICGPYDMTFRLVNLGRQEVWHPTEFLYHTWHPGQAGVDNYLGPHDGRHMSTTALEALVTKRTQPYVVNPAIAALQHPNGLGADEIDALIIPRDRASTWRLNGAGAAGLAEQASATRGLFDYRGFRVRREGVLLVANVIVEEELPCEARSLVLTASTPDAIRAQIDRAIAGVAGAAVLGGAGVMLVLRGLSAASVMALRAAHRVIAAPASIWRGGREFVRRTTDRVRRFFMERKHLSGALSSVIVNLHFVGRHARLTHGRKPVLVVESRILGSYLRVLASLNVLPPVRIVTLGANEVGAWLEEFGRNGAAASQLFIGRALYVQHYSRLAEAGLAARTTVL